VLRTKSVIVDRIFNYARSILLIFLLIFLLIYLLIFLLVFLPTGLYTNLIRGLIFIFGGGLSSSFLLILLIDVRINALHKSLGLRLPKPGLKALISFNNISFKTIAGVYK